MFFTWSLYQTLVITISEDSWPHTNMVSCVNCLTIHYLNKVVSCFCVTSIPTKWWFLSFFSRLTVWELCNNSKFFLGDYTTNSFCNTSFRIYNDFFAFSKLVYIKRNLVLCECMNSKKRKEINSGKLVSIQKKLNLVMLLPVEKK